MDAEDRRVDQVIRELEKETKRFSNEIYSVGNSLMLTAGRPIPEAEHVRQRGEGEAIVLSGPAVSAWKAGGSEWTPWSSRMVSVSINLGKNENDWLHAFSCYAPTFAASREKKEKFYDDLQHALSKIPSAEMCVILGDLNVRVGSRMSGDDE